MKITLIGLGICKGDVTLRAKEALDNATEILVRTADAESFGSLAGYEVRTLDEIYESSRNFDSLNRNLAAAVLEAGNCFYPFKRRDRRLCGKPQRGLRRGLRRGRNGDR